MTRPALAAILALAAVPLSGCDDSSKPAAPVTSAPAPSDPGPKAGAPAKKPPADPGPATAAKP